MDIKNEIGTTAPQEVRVDVYDPDMTLVDSVTNQTVGHTTSADGHTFTYYLTGRLPWQQRVITTSWSKPKPPPMIPMPGRKTKTLISGRSSKIRWLNCQPTHCLAVTSLQLQ